MAKIDHEKIIADYLAVYQSANNRSPPYHIEYERGWFCIRRPRDAPTRYLAAEIVDSTDRLRAKATERERSK
jgi:hypothetical protein